MRLTILMVLVLFMPALAFGQPHTAAPVPASLTYKFDVDYGNTSRFQGATDVGSIVSWGTYFSATSPQHTSPLTFSYHAYDNGVAASSGLVLPKTEFALGSTLTSGPYGVRVGATEYTFRNDAPFHGFGVYPYYSGECGNLEVGVESDVQKRDYAFLQAGTPLGIGKLLAGLSEERYTDYGGARHTDERIGAGYLGNLEAASVHVLLSGNYCPDSERPTWTLGFSRYASLGSGTFNPGVMVDWRKKPESSYTLFVLALGGTSLNTHASTNIHQAFFRGSLTRSRLVGNREHDTEVIGSSYEQKDFGWFTIAGSFLSLTVSDDVQLISRDVSTYVTDRHAYGLLRDPYLGITWTEFTDIVFSPAAHGLDDPMQRYWEFKAGVKLRLHERPDRANLLGELRVNAKVDTNGGWAFRSTTWF